MATALFIKDASIISTLDVEQIPELTETDIKRYSEKYLHLFSTSVDNSVTTLPADIVKLFVANCSAHNGIRIAASDNGTKNSFTLHMWIRS